jgi:hypothetical protein
MTAKLGGGGGGGGGEPASEGKHEREDAIQS